MDEVREDTMPAWTLQTGSPEETQEAARLLGGLLEGGDVVGLVGDLGTGKTCFTQGLALGLGVAPSAYVRSPTFALIDQHQGRVVLYHVDLYRLEDPDESVFIGYEDLFDGRSVVAIEWFDRFPELWPAAYLELRFEEIEGGGEADAGDARRIHIRGAGTRPAELVEAWKSAWQGRA